MEFGLEKQIQSFYIEMLKGENIDYKKLACNLVPKLVNKIRELEKQIDKLTCESSDTEKEII